MVAPLRGARLGGRGRQCGIADRPQPRVVLNVIASPVCYWIGFLHNLCVHYKCVLLPFTVMLRIFFSAV